MFASGEALLEDESALRADCFILVIHLPGAFGFELRQQIKIRGGMAPMILITPYDDLAAPEHARAIGAVAIFAKPHNCWQYCHLGFRCVARAPSSDR